MRVTDTKSFIKKACKVHGGRYDYSLAHYINNKTKVILICKEHGEFLQSPHKHLIGRGCQVCGGSKKKTTSEFIAEAKNIHNNKYDYSYTEYENAFTKVKIICKIHGIFLQKPHLHLQKYGCMDCGGNKKLSINQFIDRAHTIHNNKYNYHNTLYKNMNTKVCITCHIHGDFYQQPKNHLLGKGCHGCAKSHPLTQKEFIGRANFIHNHKYSYDKLIFKNTYSNIIIICNIHGEFRQQASDHLNGHGCQFCSKNKKLDTKSFIDKAKAIHNNTYNYNELSYSNARTNVKIICKLHGSFLQSPQSHLKGYGCIKCSALSSKPENEWLNNLNIKYENRQISLPNLPKKIKVDGFDPKTNTVYEFLGGFWHGDPTQYDFNKLNSRSNKSFGDLYEKTIKREIIIRKAGYNYQFIWESDFLQKDLN